MTSSHPAPPSMPPFFPPLTLIVATTPSLGIGRAGSLPWPPLKSDLAFFARVTKRVPPPPPPSPGTSQIANGSRAPARKTKNAVIMGRKTWESIPPRFRPLKERINVVITRSPESFHERSADERGGEDVLAAPSIETALKDLQQRYPPLENADGGDGDGGEKTIGLGRAFVIGGADVYKLALKMDAGERVLWTRLQGEWNCDTFFPRGILGSEDDTSGTGEARDEPWGRWIKKDGQDLEEWTSEKGSSGPKQDGEIAYEVFMVEKERS